MNFIKNAFIYFVIANLFCIAPLHFLYSFILKSEYLNYSLTAVFVILISLYRRQQISKIITRHAWIFSYFLIVILYSLSFEDYKVIGFLLYELIPFYFFALFKDDLIETITTYKKTVVVTFIISVSGIIYDYYYDFPWKALSFSIGGRDVELSKNWSADSVERVAGFFRSSDQAAAGVIFLCILLLYINKNFILNHIIIITTFFCVYLTTTKTALVALLIIYILYVLEFLRLEFRKRLIYWLIVAMIFAVILLPLGFVTDLNIPFLNNYSFKDRLVNEWPFVVNQFNNFIQYILGLGMGSIGAAQVIFGKTKIASPGDNFFLFLYGNFGIITLGIFYRIYKNLKDNRENITIYLGVFLLSYGITYGVLESPLNLLILVLVAFYNSNSNNLLITEQRINEGSYY